MVREPVLIGGLNVLVSYTRFHRNYQPGFGASPHLLKVTSISQLSAPSTPAAAPRVPVTVITGFQSLVRIVGFLLLLS